MWVSQLTCSVHLPLKLRPADREAKAKFISAEGEQRASRKLKEAADVMDESPATLQLRYLQTLNTISAENNHTYVFPLPLGKLFW